MPRENIISFQLEFRGFHVSMARILLACRHTAMPAHTRYAYQLLAFCVHFTTHFAASSSTPPLSKAPRLIALFYFYCLLSLGNTLMYILEPHGKMATTITIDAGYRLDFTLWVAYRCVAAQLVMPLYYLAGFPMKRS